MSNNLKAIVWMVIHIILSALLNMGYRLLNDSLSKIHIAFLINAFTFLTILPWAFYTYKKDKQIFKSSYWTIHLFRSGLSVSSQVLLIYAFTNMEFAQVSAITLLYPLLGTLGGAIFFKEKLGAHHNTALLVGFIGALIIINPSYSGFNLYSLLVIIAMILWVGIDLLVRRIRHNEKVSTQIFYTLMFLCVVSAIPATFSGLPSLRLMLDYKFLLLGILFVFYMLSGFIAIIETESIGIVMPFYFLVLILAIIIGYFVFNESIKISTVIGSVLILASTSYIAYKEAKMGNSHAVTKKTNLA